jgi:hypothetical protein
MRVHAAQHVSGVLTSKQSPRGQAGYQTLFYTQEQVAPDEMRIIERQVQYSSAREGKATWQSYRVSDHRHVISRIIPISEPDEFGRQGRFFSHSLIFGGSGGLQVDEFLLDLLRPSEFLSSLDEVLASDGLKTGHIPAVSLDVKRERVKEAQTSLRDWSGPQLNQLYMLMSDPRQLIEQGRYVALVGSDEEIVAALKVAFLLTPVSARKICSFDTNARGGNESSTITFWGRGVSAAGPASYIIDAARREIAISDSSALLADGFSLEMVSAALRGVILDRLDRPSEQMLYCLLNRKYAAFIAEPIYQALLHESDLTLTGTELELLTRFNQIHSGLALLVALKSGDESQRLQTLAAMDLSSYKQRLGELRTRGDFKPWQVFSPIFMPAWFDLLRGTYSIDDITTTIATVADHGSKQDREYVGAIHEYLNPGERQALGRWLRSSPHDFGDLQAALDKPVSTRANHTGNSSWRRVLNPFRK